MLNCHSQITEDTLTSSANSCRTFIAFANCLPAFVRAYTQSMYSQAFIVLSWASDIPLQDRNQSFIIRSEDILELQDWHQHTLSNSGSDPCIHLVERYQAYPLWFLQQICYTDDEHWRPVICGGETLMVIFNLTKNYVQCAIIHVMHYVKFTSVHATLQAFDTPSTLSVETLQVCVNYLSIHHGQDQFSVSPVSWTWMMKYNVK